MSLKSKTPIRMANPSRTPSISVDPQKKKSLSRIKYILQLSCARTLARPGLIKGSMRAQRRKRIGLASSNDTSLHACSTWLGGNE